MAVSSIVQVSVASLQYLGGAIALRQPRGPRDSPNIAVLINSEIITPAYLQSQSLSYCAMEYNMTVPRVCCCDADIYICKQDLQDTS